MKNNIITKSLLISALTLSMSGCIIHVGGHNDNNNKHSDYSSVFGGVEIEANRQVGDLTSVNGNIEMADNSSAKDLDAVNGNIELGQNVSVDELSTVNGNIQAQTNLIVKRDITTVNGTIQLGKHASVGGDISTVNGDILLTSSTVQDDVKTKNGSISLTNQTVIKGDIEFESPEGNSMWSEKKRQHNPPTLTIDATSRVEGRIILRQKVILEIANDQMLDKIERKY